ncbi:MAG: EAL domain-containing protein [Planctomycetes bacterium]|nr:EAL domain-containing protein [Planctomycetota bacterium]
MSDRPREPCILIVEDSPTEALRLQLVLDDAGFEPAGVSLLSDALGRASEGGIDAIVLDLTLPDSEGLQTIARMIQAAPNVPIVVLTGQHDENLGLQALKEGAQDYLVKGQADGQALVRSIRYAIERQRMQMALKAAHDRMERLALIDPWTELLNRRGLERVYAIEVDRMKRGGSELVAVIVDLDNFKRINDGLGYVVGDMVLKEVGIKLKTSLRPYDHLARIGGDEFMILLPETRWVEGMRVAERIRLAVSESPIGLASESIKITASLGVLRVSADLPSVEVLISQAYLGIARCKRTGKNRVCDAENLATGDGGDDLLASVTEALRTGNHFRAVSQPIMRLHDERPVGYEILVRGPAGVFEMPAVFFRLCLEKKILTLVDCWCLKACIAATEALDGSARFHLNVFPSTLLDIPADRILELFPANRQKGQFCLEISEQQIIGDMAALLKPIEAFRRAGIHISIDDVGFGYSYLERLILLEPNIVKIDIKCVEGIAKDSFKERSLRRLVKVVDSLGAEAIAEGIGNREDLDVVRNLGLQYGQGFLWGHPK